MNHCLHYSWTQRMLLDTGMHPRLANLIARANAMVDKATPGKFSTSKITGNGEMPPITQIDIETAELLLPVMRERLCAGYRITTIYHFGGKAAVREGRACQENDGYTELTAAWETLERKLSTLSWKEIEALLQKQNKDLLYLAIQVGALLHLWMDSFTHQSYCGWPTKNNASNDKKETLFKKIWTSLLPDKLAWGHVEDPQADTLEAVWQRNGVRIDNRERFIRMGNMAAKLFRVKEGSLCLSALAEKNDKTIGKYCEDSCEKYLPPELSVEFCALEEIELDIFREVAADLYL